MRSIRQLHKGNKSWVRNTSIMILWNRTHVWKTANIRQHLYTVLKRKNVAHDKILTGQGISTKSTKWGDLQKCKANSRLFLRFNDILHSHFFTSRMSYKNSSSPEFRVLMAWYAHTIHVIKVVHLSEICCDGQIWYYKFITNKTIYKIYNSLSDKLLNYQSILKA